MDKLEQYLDQVCRGIAGPRALRQHIRQELREHLLDAAAEYTRAGMPEPEAIARALEDFGGPEQVRRELEATHGHRVMAVVIDKALQWKEVTMKAKWLWTSWAHLALAGVIALEVLFICLTLMFVAPKCQLIVRDFGRGHEAEPMIAWMPRFLAGVEQVQHCLVWGLIALVACWIFFEWRVRSENKSFIRLSALGTTALGLMAAVVLTAASLLLPVVMVAPMGHR